MFGLGFWQDVSGYVKKLFVVAGTAEDNSGTDYRWRSFSSSNSGTTWVDDHVSGNISSTLVPNYYFTGAVCKPSTNIILTWSLQTSSIIKKSSDGGVTWANKNLPSSMEVSSLIHITGDTFYGYASNGVTIYTTDAGETWSNGASLTSNTIWTGMTYNPGASTVLLVGQPVSGTVRRAVSTDAMGSWTTGTTPSSGNIGVVWDATNALYLSIASSGTNKIFSSSNGTTWTARSTAANFNSIDTQNGNSVAFNDSGGVPYYSSNGTSWTAGSAITTSTLFGNIKADSGNFYITRNSSGAGTSGIVMFKSTDNGANFSNVGTIEASKYAITPTKITIGGN